MKRKILKKQYKIVCYIKVHIFQDKITLYESIVAYKKSKDQISWLQVIF